MSRASSSRAAMESRMPRISCEEIAIRPIRSPRRAAMGASGTGGRSTASPGSASRKPLTQLTSGNSRITCRKASAIPIRRTPIMSALRPGLARNAVQICRYSTTTTSEHRIRNTSIRTRKIRGEESLKGSMSCSMANGSSPQSAHNTAASRRKEEPEKQPGMLLCSFRLTCARPSRFSEDSACGVPHAVRFPERPQHVPVNRLVAGKDAFRGQRDVAPLEIGDKAAGLAHERNPGRHVPRREPALPIGIDAAGRDPCKIERRRSEPAQPGGPFLYRRMLAARQRDIATAGVRQGARNNRFGKPLASRHAQPAIIQEGALAALGGEQLITDGIVDDAGNDRALALERNRDREMRDAVQKVQGAVKRIDDPAMGLVRAFVAAAFLAEEAVARTRRCKLGAQRLLGPTVGRSHEIGGTLERNLQVLELAEIPLERTARFLGGFDHHVEEGGTKHARERRKAGVSGWHRPLAVLVTSAAVRPAQTAYTCLRRVCPR